MTAPSRRRVVRGSLLRNVPLSFWFAFLFFWMDDAVAQSLARSEVTQGEVVELQWRAFREFSQHQRERGAAIDDAVRTLGVDRIFARILTVALQRFPQAVSLRWEVLLTGDEGIEARAYPSGQIVVGDDFLSRFVRSEAELAFVVAHEVAHIVLEHGRLGYEAAVPLTKLAGPVDASLIDENLNSSLSLRLRLAPLLRAQEGEADRLGADLAAAAGFDRSAAADLLARLVADEDASSSSRDPLRSRRAALWP